MAPPALHLQIGRALGRGFAVLPRPDRTWIDVREDPLPVRALVLAYALVFAIFPFLGTMVGGLIADRPAGVVLVGAFLYPLLLLGLTVGLGLALSAVSTRLGAPVGQSASLQLAFYVSTPLWLTGLMLAVPLVEVQTIAPFVGLSWTGWLMLSGVPGVLGVVPERCLVSTSVLFAGFTAGFVLLDQVLLVHLLA